MFGNKESEIREIKDLLSIVLQRLNKLTTVDNTKSFIEESLIKDKNLKSEADGCSKFLGSKRKAAKNLFEEANDEDTGIDGLIGDTHPYHIVTVFCSKMKYKSPQANYTQDRSGQYVTCINVENRYIGEGKAGNKKDSKSIFYLNIVNASKIVLEQMLLDNSLRPKLLRFLSNFTSVNNNGDNNSRLSSSANVNSSKSLEVDDFTMNNNIINNTSADFNNTNPFYSANVNSCDADPNALAKLNDFKNKHNIEIKFDIESNVKIDGGIVGHKAIVLINGELSKI
jgi:hypothetical protein